MAAQHRETLDRVRITGDQELARFRRSSSRMLIAFLIGCFFVIGLAGATRSDARFDEESVYDSDSLAEYGFRAFYGMIAVVSLAVSVGWLRKGILATSSGVTVRNLVRRVHVPWDQIERFERPARYGAMRRTGLQIHRRDGVIVYASLYSAGPFNRPTFADDVLAELEILRRRMTAGDRLPEPQGSESPADSGSNRHGSHDPGSPEREANGDGR